MLNLARLNPSEVVGQGVVNWIEYAFMPPYSPDLNPIEMAFSKLKSHLKTAAMRSFDELLHKIGNICDMFSPQECFNYFKMPDVKSFVQNS